jgi:hypothetical protein
MYEIRNYVIIVGQIGLQLKTPFFDIFCGERLALLTLVTKLAETFL